MVMDSFEWVCIGNNAYILPDWLALFVYDNVKVSELEYIVKAFQLLKPKNREEAEYFLNLLRKTDAKEIIFRIYDNGCGK